MGVLKKEEEKELLKSISSNEIIEKEVTPSWDGRSLIIRIPKEIADFCKINKKNRHNKIFKLKVETKDEKILKSFDIINKNEKDKK